MALGRPVHILTISFACSETFWVLGSTKFVNIHPIPPRLAGARRGRAAVFPSILPPFYSPTHPHFLWRCG